METVQAEALATDELETHDSCQETQMKLDSAQIEAALWPQNVEILKVATVC